MRNGKHARLENSDQDSLARSALAALAWMYIARLEDDVIVWPAGQHLCDPVTQHVSHFSAERSIFYEHSMSIQTFLNDL